LKSFSPKSVRKALAAAALIAAGCRPEAAPPAKQAASAPEPERPVVLFLGDSLTAGYGVAMEEAYPALLQERWPAYEMRNAGVSGSTSKGVLDNLAWNLTPEVDFVFIAIGANDGLRGLDLEKTEKNIESIVAACLEKKVRVALAGIMIPPNYGEEYAARFEGMYPKIAKRRGLPLLPFLLDGVGGRPEMNIEDGIHPNAAGHRRVAEAVESFLKKEGWLK
jgi:acyl-CoA thioesterase-1